MNQREAFEMWRADLCANEMAAKASIQREGEWYCSTHTQIAWQAWQAATAIERESCAKIAEQTVCDTHIPTGVKIYGTRAAKNIRDRP